MPAIIALLLCAGCGAAAASDIALVGLIGDKAAVLAVDGGDPKTVKVGQKWNGITVLAVERDRATIEYEGSTRVLRQGEHYPRAAAARTDAQEVVLAAGPGGHFVGEGLVNGIGIRFLVDTGATSIALPASDAQRLGLDYRKGPRRLANTANGTVEVYRVMLDTVRLGAIELHAVDAVVFERGLTTALLGMSFLNRVVMKRDGATMTLTRRF